MAIFGFCHSEALAEESLCNWCNTYEEPTLLSGDKVRPVRRLSCPSTARPDNVYAITPLRFTLTIQLPSVGA